MHHANDTGAHNVLHQQAPKKTPQGDWRPTAIVAALHDAGWTVRKLAEYHGLKGAGGLSQALRRSAPVSEQRIAAALGLHPKEIWPSRYEADGSRKPQGFNAVIVTAAQRARNGKSRSAA